MAEQGTGGAKPEAVAIIVMGPSGTGKTTIAKGLASALGWPFAEADAFHPKANIDKMTAGTPLTDEDRWPWLGAIRDWITARGAEGASTVVTCSALKRRYRDLLREAGAQVRFVSLSGDPDLIATRIGSRTGHFMPPSLLKSQFADLEPLQPDEGGVTVCVDRPAAEVVVDALQRLGLGAVAGRS